jgi:hypothetical protein
MHNFMEGITRLTNVDATKLEYLSDEGNLEIKVNPMSTGAEVTVLGIPNMAKDDRIEFEFVGYFSETAGQ